jgi:Cu-Zn family superoxide dismutase
MTDSGVKDSGGTDSGGNSEAGDSGETTITSSIPPWVVYPDPYGDGGVANPITATIMGSADAFAEPGGAMRLKLQVTGLPPNRKFGSHLHKLACDNNKAGGPYQNNPFPDGGSANDPQYANSANEAWLDFTTDANGAGSAQTTVNWQPRAGEAKAIMIHDMATTDGGVAGAKLACLNIPF